MTDHGSWHVYMVANKNIYQGKIYLADEGLAFKATADLLSDAKMVTEALIIGVGGSRNEAYDIVVPYEKIIDVKIEKQMMVMKNLVVKIDSGESLTFRFGMLSPQNALDKLNELRG